MIIEATLTNAATLLNSAEAANEAQLLLQHALNVNRAWLITHQDYALEDNIHEAYRALINRRINGEPIAYILGYREFYGLKLKVTPDTLIPRPDTETLVDAALANIDSVTISLTPALYRRESALTSLVLPAAEGNQAANLCPSPAGWISNDLADVVYQPSQMLSCSIRRVGEKGESSHEKRIDSRARGNDEQESVMERNKQFTILDLGTGSGAIALAIAKHQPQAHVTALDASQAALDIAIENAQNLNIRNVRFLLSDWFSVLIHQNIALKFDIIVSNPPYIEAEDAHLKQGDLCFEPLSALASGAEGLDDIRKIIAQAPNHLKPHGCLLLEHGYNQAEAVANLLKKAGFSEIETIKDLGGNNRVTLGKIS